MNVSVQITWAAFEDKVATSPQYKLFLLGVHTGVVSDTVEKKKISSRFIYALSYSIGIPLCSCEVIFIRSLKILISLPSELASEKSSV